MYVIRLYRVVLYGSNVCFYTFVFVATAHNSTKARYGRIKSLAERKKITKGIEMGCENGKKSSVQQKRMDDVK